MAHGFRSPQLAKSSSTKENFTDSELGSKLRVAPAAGLQQLNILLPTDVHCHDSDNDWQTEGTCIPLTFRQNTTTGTVWIR